MITSTQSGKTTVQLRPGSPPLKAPSDIKGARAFVKGVLGKKGELKRLEDKDDKRVEEIAKAAEAEAKKKAAEDRKAAEAKEKAEAEAKANEDRKAAEADARADKERKTEARRLARTNAEGAE